MVNLAFFAALLAAACTDTNEIASGDADLLSGELEVLIADYDDHHEYQYYLVTNDDRRVRLRLSGGPSELATGDFVSVSGSTVASASGLTEFAVSEVVSHSLSLREDSAQLRPPLNHRTAVILISGTTITREDALAQINPGANTAPSYIAENSQGIDTFEGDVFGPYDIDASNCGNRASEIARLATAAFTAEGHDVDDYQHLAFVIPPRTNCGWGGLGMVGRPGSTRQLTTWYNNWFDCRVVAHELGHNLGLSHARLLQCGNEMYSADAAACSAQEYGHVFDVMGAGRCQDGHLAAASKEYMGWMDGCEAVTAGGDDLFTLSPLEGSCGVRSVRIPAPGNTPFYYLEYRQSAAGDYGGARGENRVVLSVSTDPRSGRPQTSLLDATPTSGQTRDSALSVGTTYNLPGNVQIEVLEVGALARVRVRMPPSGGPTCDDGSRAPRTGNGDVGSSCGDSCPNDPDKVEPGVCGCGRPDTDRDSDGSADCQDGCPSDPAKTTPGECGCGRPEGSCSCVPSCPGDRCGQDDGCGGSCSNADANTCDRCGNAPCDAGPTITASSENDARNEGKDKAFDGLISTKWLAFGDSAWIQYDFAGDEARVVVEYQITSANDVPARDPRDWRLLGSNNGATWTVVDARSNESFAGRFTTNVYEIANPGAFRMYRLDIRSNLNPSAARATQLAEIALVEQTCVPTCTGDQCGQDDGCGGTCSDADVATCGKCGNATCAAVITASGENRPREGKEKAFDGQAATKWLVFADAGWVQYDYPGDQAVVVNEYRITSANDARERDPKDWRLLGSNNGVGWLVLDQRSDQQFPNRFQTRTFSFDNRRAFRMYRLDIKSNLNPPAANSTQLAELELVERPDGGDDGGDDPGTGTGLSATYYDNADFTSEALQRVDATVDFVWGRGAPAPSIEEDTFSVRWQGFVEAPVSGTYTFFTRSDDGVRLRVDDVPLIDNWTDHGPTEDSGSIALTAGQRYPVQLEYYENGGGSTIQLSWQANGIAKTIVPQKHLYPANSSLPLQHLDSTGTTAGGCHAAGTTGTHGAGWFLLALATIVSTRKRRQGPTLSRASEQRDRVE